MSIVKLHMTFLPFLHRLFLWPTCFIITSFNIFEYVGAWARNLYYSNVPVKVDWQMITGTGRQLWSRRWQREEKTTDWDVMQQREWDKDKDRVRKSKKERNICLFCGMKSKIHWALHRPNQTILRTRGQALWKVKNKYIYIFWVYCGSILWKFSSLLLCSKNPMDEISNIHWECGRDQLHRLCLFLYVPSNL